MNHASTLRHSKAHRQAAAKAAGKILHFWTITATLNVYGEREARGLVAQESRSILSAVRDAGGRLHGPPRVEAEAHHARHLLRVTAIAPRTAKFFSPNGTHWVCELGARAMDSGAGHLLQAAPAEVPQRFPGRQPARAAASENGWGG